MMNKTLLSSALLALFSYSAHAEVTAIEWYQNTTHKFTFNSQADIADSYLFIPSELGVYPINNINDSRRAIQIIDSNNQQSLFIVRPAYDTYVIQQTGNDGKISYTTIQKAGGGVQPELYHYLLNEPYSTGTTVTSGVSSVVKTKMDQLITLVANSKAGSVYDGLSLKKQADLSSNDVTALKETLNDVFIDTNTPPIDPVVPSSFFRNILNNYLKNGATQGNPASYVAQMAYYDQTLDLGGVANNNTDKTQQYKSRFAVKARLSNYSIDGQDTQVYTVTPSYTYEMSKGWGLLFDLPLSYVDRAKQTTYNIAMGVGLRIPVMRYDSVNWDLIPLGRIGGANLDCLDNNSLVCADSSMVYSGGILSNFGLNLGAGFSLLLQDQYTYQNIDPNSKNVRVFSDALLRTKEGTVDVYRNGAQLNKQTDYVWFGHRVNSSISFVDTRYGSSYGSYIDSQQEYGISMNLRDTTRHGMEHDIKIGVTYTSAKHMSDAVFGSISMSF